MLLSFGGAPTEFDVPGAVCVGLVFCGESEHLVDSLDEDMSNLPCFATMEEALFPETFCNSSEVASVFWDKLFLNGALRRSLASVRRSGPVILLPKG